MNALFNRLSISLVPLVAAIVVAPASAQVPVDDSGAPLAEYESLSPEPAAGNEGIPLLTSSELQELVGPIALYPDDLLAIVLPASTYPLQLVQAQRFLEDLEEDPSLKPDEAWDDSVVALLNYPEVLALLNEDLDWTWRLGEAVVAQQADVVDAVTGFRDRAYTAGNLKSDTHQTVARSGEAIEITPVDDDVIYVPYYEPERVVVYQPRPVYHYYSRPYPVYYYPYPVGYSFSSGYFWGVTTAFTVGWLTDSVHVIHHSYHGHPYYGHRYWDGWWYRRPTVHVHNHYYAGDRYSVSRHRYSHGDEWRPRYDTRRRLHNQRIVRSDYYAARNVQRRSYGGTATHASDRRVRNVRHDERTVERRRSSGTGAVDSRRDQRRTAVPTAARQAPRREVRPDQDLEARRRVAERGQQSMTQRQTRRDYAAAGNHGGEQVAPRRSQREAGARPERRAETPRRQDSRGEPRAEPRGERRGEQRAEQRREQRPSGDRKQARNDERKRHASSRGDSERRRRR